jgi:hypothetical protein
MVAFGANTFDPARSDEVAAECEHGQLTPGERRGRAATTAWRTDVRSPPTDPRYASIVKSYKLRR